LTSLLSVENLVKTFGGLHAVDDLSFQLEKEKLVGIVGPNGSGKTTLFNLISGAVKPTSGKIYLNEDRIDGLEPYEIFHRGIVRSYQIPRLFYGMSVRENSLLSPRNQIGEKVMKAPIRSSWVPQESELTHKALELLGMLQLSRLSNDSAANLSGGQQKLLEIGRALMGEPSILLLDEPTAGVSPKLAVEIFERIVDLQKRFHLTFLIIEHRLEVLFDYVEWVHVMDKGKLIYSGPPLEVSKNLQVIDAYLGY
jgi:branched-chain amino acid transport system ATP-binding protein